MRSGPRENNVSPSYDTRAEPRSFPSNTVSVFSPKKDERHKLFVVYIVSIVSFNNVCQVFLFSSFSVICIGEIYE